MSENSAAEVAEWMARRIAEDGSLPQREAARYIATHFGQQFLYTNKNGNAAISQEVLDRFNSVVGKNKTWKGYPQFTWYQSDAQSSS